MAKNRAGAAYCAGAGLPTQSLTRDSRSLPLVVMPPMLMPIAIVPPMGVGVMIAVIAIGRGVGRPVAIVLGCNHRRYGAEHGAKCGERGGVITPAGGCRLQAHRGQCD
jgi:hypothetical protein